MESDRLPKVRRVETAQLRLYLVTDERGCRGRSLPEIVSAAVRGGVTCVQLREKMRPTREFLNQACAVRPILRKAGVPLVINDRLDVALACDADGVHVGQSDFPVEIARRLLPKTTFIGLSIESLADIDAAADFDVDYFGISPVFPTLTKTDTKAPWGLAGLRLARRRTTLPLIAIGGIHAGVAADVFAAGADGIAVVSAICAADDPEKAARELSDVAASTRTHP
jgi:thiamine-phosphate pyrophosphorylase